jgi:signal transduction histidine kinase
MISLDSVLNKSHDQKRDILRSLRFALAAMVTGAMLGISTVGFIYLLVFGYYIFTPEIIESQEAARKLAIGWAPSLFFVLGACTLAFTVGYRSRRYGVRLGLVVGLSAATVEQLIVLFEYPPVLPNELLSYMIFGLSGGVVGGWFSVLEVARTEIGERTLFNETINIARAGDPDRVAEAIGVMAGQCQVAGVGLWKTSPFSEHSVMEPTGIWEADGRETFPVAALLGAVERRTRTRGNAQNLLAETLNREAKRVWVDVGVRSAFVGPTICMGAESLGYLFVGFRRTTLLTGASRRRLLSAAAAAGLALEKLSSIERQRRQDRELGVMEERERVSREIHDSLIQYLGSIAGDLDAAEMAGKAGAEEMIPHHISRAREAARLAASESRRFMRALRPVVLERSSFPEALKALTQRSLESSGIETTVKVIGEARPLPPKTEHDLIRIAQEALSNAQKHSHASLVTVSLSFEDDHVRLEVADNGVGLEASHATKGTSISNDVDDPTCGFGLQSVRERTERIGGQMSVESLEGTGTTIIVKAPAEYGIG